MSDISIMSRTCAEVDSNFRRRWGAFVATSVYGHYQQTVEYATLRQNSGWRARFVWKETEGQIAAGTLLLSKGLAGLGLGLGMGMMPCGPIWQHGHEPSVRHVLEAVGEHCAANGIVFCRSNMRCCAEEFREIAALLPRPRRELQQIWSYWNLSRACMEMDISEPLETLLNRMHRHTRQEYRKSQECGVRVRKADGTQISELVRLLSLTSERKRLRAHETGYFSVLLNTYDPENVNLLLAEANGEVIGATLEVTDGRTAYWLYGGFDYGKRHFHPNVALQIEMIRWAQHRGCKYYDLGDACTSWPPLETDKGYGVFRFKTRLGAQAKLCAPYCDFIYRPVLYRLAGLAENIGLPFAMESGKSKILVAVQRLRVNRELV